MTTRATEQKASLPFASNISTDRENASNACKALQEYGFKVRSSKYKPLKGLIILLPRETRFVSEKKEREIINLLQKVTIENSSEEFSEKVSNVLLKDYLRGGNMLQRTGAASPLSMKQFTTFKNHRNTIGAVQNRFTQSLKEMRKINPITTPPKNLKDSNTPNNTLRKLSSIVFAVGLLHVAASALKKK